ncbi:hypothetical protein SLA2020_061460 [Shorea laevis]
MRSDRALHNQNDEDDEESCSLQSSGDDDLDMEMEVDVIEHAKFQSVQGEADGDEAIPEGDVEWPNAVDGKGTKVISPDDEVASCSDETKYTKKMEVELAKLGGTSFERVAETEVFCSNLNGVGDLKTNTKRLGKVKTVGSNLKNPIIIAVQGDIENASQMSTNATGDSYGLSNQNKISEDCKMGIEADGCRMGNGADGCGMGMRVDGCNRPPTTGLGPNKAKDQKHKAEAGCGLGNKADGPTSKGLGRNKNNAQNHKAVEDSNRPPPVGIKEQIKKNNGKPISKNNESSSSF